MAVGCNTWRHRTVPRIPSQHPPRNIGPCWRDTVPLRRSRLCALHQSSPCSLPAALQALSPRPWQVHLPVFPCLPTSLGPPPSFSRTIVSTKVGFGFGKHACPGRFFVPNEIKTFIAHMVLYYDIQYVTTRRQEMTPLIWLNIPLFKDPRVNIRRRKPVELHTA